MQLFQADIISEHGKGTLVEVSIEAENEDDVVPVKIMVPTSQLTESGGHLHLPQWLIEKKETEIAKDNPSFGRVGIRVDGEG